MIIPKTGGSIIIACDECGETARATAAQVVRIKSSENPLVLFKRQGWLLEPYVDTCPACQAAEEDEQVEPDQLARLGRYLLEEWNDHPGWVIDYTCPSGESSVELAIAILKTLKVQLGSRKLTEDEVQSALGSYTMPEPITETALLDVVRQAWDNGGEPQWVVHDPNRPKP